MKMAYYSSRLMTAFVLACVFSHLGAPLYAQLNLSPPADVSATPGTAITIPLNLNNPDSMAIDAFGVTFFYPTGLLAFDTTQNAGTLTDGWILVGGKENVAGQITLGGFHAMAARGSGVLINVIFRVKDDTTGKDSLKLRKFADDLATAKTTDGVLTIVTAVESRHADRIPVRMELFQNYPNPFNPETRIKFQLSQKSRVRIEVVNLLDQQIAMLLDEQRPAGYCELQWDGRNGLGEPVPSGVYILRVRAEGYVQSRKMLLLK